MKIAPAFMPAKAPSLPSRHGAQVVVIADAGEDEIGAVGGFGRRRRRRAADARRPFLGLCGGAVIDRHVVTALALRWPAIGIAHDAKTDEGDFGHCRDCSEGFWPATLGSSGKVDTGFRAGGRRGEGASLDEGGPGAEPPLSRSTGFLVDIPTVHFRGGTSIVQSWAVACAATLELWRRHSLTRAALRHCLDSRRQQGHFLTLPRFLLRMR